MGTKAKDDAESAVAIKEDAAAGIYDYGEDVGSGFQNQTSDDVAIPFISIVQSNSQEMTEDSFKEKGIEAGMIINRTTGDLYKALSFIPAYTDHKFVEWVPIDDGGGYVGDYEIDDPVVLKCKSEQPLGKYKLEGGNELIETFYVYGVLVTEEGDHMPAVIPFASTNIKAYKDWQFRAKSIMIKIPGGRRVNPPLFAHRYKLTTLFQKRDKQSWYKFDTVQYDGENAVAARLSPSSELYQDARSVMDGISAGTMKVDHKNADRGTGTRQDSAPAKADEGDEEVPF